MILSTAMKNIILSLVIPLMLTACNGGNSAAKGITRPQQSTINILEQLDRLEHANTSLPKLTISSDALYRELTNKLAQRDWRDANNILLLLHYIQITSIREASARSPETVVMTVKAIYSYETDKIIPLLKKYISPDDVIDFNNLYRAYKDAYSGLVLFVCICDLYASNSLGRIAFVYEGWD